MKWIKKKERSMIIIGFLCGIVARCLMLLFKGRFSFFSFSAGIPEYILRRMPYGIFSCLLYGMIGGLIGLLFYLVKKRI